MTEEEEFDLWSRYKASDDLELRNQLIEVHLPLVKRAAERMHFSLAGKVEVDELYSSGLLGLIDAISRYIPSKNTKFSTFSAQRIRGAMLDSIRNLDWVPDYPEAPIKLTIKLFKNFSISLVAPPAMTK